MLRPDGFLKVLDFGLAKLLPAREQVEAQSTQTAFRTEAGTVVGTIAYMSPEQARGEERRVECTKGSLRSSMEPQVPRVTTMVTIRINGPSRFSDAHSTPANTQ